MGLFKKKTKIRSETKPKSKLKVVSADGPEDKPVAGKLPLEWYARNESAIHQWQDPLPKLAVESRYSKDKAEKEAIPCKLIDHYERYREYCYSKDECWKKWFSDSWEYVHNSKNPDFDYIDPYKKQLSKCLAKKQ